MQDLPADINDRWKRNVLPLLSVVIYICAVSGADPADQDIRDAKTGTRRPTVPVGKRLFVSGMPTLWEAGWRMGAALGAASSKAEAAYLGGTHAGPVPHVRRAHWHHYWRGPRTNRELIVKWLHPILVGSDETVPAVRRVGYS